MQSAVYCMDGHLLKLKCKYSNILIIKIKTKKTFEVFYM